MTFDRNDIHDALSGALPQNDSLIILSDGTLTVARFNPMLDKWIDSLHEDVIEETEDAFVAGWIEIAGDLIKYIASDFFARWHLLERWRESHD